MRNTVTQYLSKEESDHLLTVIKIIRHKVIVLLLIDCGLRITECIRLRYSDLNLEARIINVPLLRTKYRGISRFVPISNRLYQELANLFFEDNDPSIITSDLYIFRARNPANHITRPSINRFLIRAGQKMGLKKLYPHALRHTFATQHLTAGTPIQQISQMMGHINLNTMNNYRKIPIEIRKHFAKKSLAKTAIKKIISALHYKRWWRKPIPASNIIVIPTMPQVQPHSPRPKLARRGRDEILKTLHELVIRKINTVIIGGIGVGKSYLLEAFEESVENSETVKILKLDDLHDLKSSLAEMLIYVLKTDMPGLYDHLFPDYDYRKSVAKVSRKSAIHIAKEVVKVTEKKLYTLVIDNVDQINAAAVKILELFKDHFTIITSARAVPLTRSSFLWNFEIIRLQPLSRKFALQLINLLSYGMQPEDLWLYKNHIYEQTNGNPRAINEMIERYRKEPSLTNDIVREIHHTGALPEYDCTFFVVIFLSCVACLRYLNHEVQNASFRVLGGVALVFLFISRYFFKYTKKKNV